MKQDIKRPSILFIILSSFFTIVGLLDERIIALVMLIALLLMIKEDGASLFMRRSIRLLFLFYIIVLLYAAIGYGTLNVDSFKGRIFAVITVMFAYCTSYHIKLLNLKQIKSILISLIVIITISVLATTFVGMIDPMALRVYGMGGVTDEEIRMATMYRSMGMMSYSVAHAMSVVTAGLSLIVCYDKNKLLRLFSFILLLLVFRLLFVMTITTALLVSIIASVVVFSNYLSKGHLLRGLLFATTLTVFFFIFGFSTSILNFSENSNMGLFYKLNDFFTLIQTGESTGQVEGREGLYSASFNTFFSNPIFGGGKDNGSRTVIGEHSYLLDYLAYYGFFALLYFLAWWTEYKMLFKRINPILKVNYFFAFFPALTLVVLKAESVCIILPFATLVFVQVVFLYENNNLKIVE